MSAGLLRAIWVILYTWGGISLCRSVWGSNMDSFTRIFCIVVMAITILTWIADDIKKYADSL